MRARKLDLVSEYPPEWVYDSSSPSSASRVFVSFRTIASIRRVSRARIFFSRSALALCTVLRLPFARSGAYACPGVFGEDPEQVLPVHAALFLDRETARPN